MILLEDHVVWAGAEPLCDLMFTLKQIVSVEQIIKKSRFMAVAGPVASEQDALAFIAAQSRLDAHHNCWAWRVGQSYRFNDDGEPSGSAGRPILQAIDGLQLTGVAVVVTRWFGGILLGSGGLVRAYGGTAAVCLRASTLIEVYAVEEAIITTNFSDHALVKARLTSATGVKILNETFTETGAVIKAALRETVVQQVVQMIIDITSGRARVALPVKRTGDVV